ncbi:MAG: DUF547 domain-containing protein [Saprospiraceae bacterium]|nr:DUF547 domain-containing protein [Saprospiraceae bacterium]
MLLSINVQSQTLSECYTSYQNLLTHGVNRHGEVNYSYLKNQKIKLIAISEAMISLHEEPSTKNEQIAYWINIYNIMTLRLIIENYPLQSIMDLDHGKVWDRTVFHFNKKIKTLNDIEHKILRENWNEPRIHFAINCAAKSCPPLYNIVFLPNLLEEQLDSRTRDFINSAKFNIIQKSSCKLSKIFDWYGKDFGNLIFFINKYSVIKINSSTKIIFLDYDWSLNKA